MSSVGLGAILNVAKLKKGSTVAIFGLGAVGLAVSLSSLVQRYQFLDWSSFGVPFLKFSFACANEEAAFVVLHD